MAFWDWIEKIAQKQWRQGKDALPIEVTGRNFKHVKNVLTTTPLAAETSYTSSWFDLTSIDKGSSVGFMLYADTPTRFTIRCDPGSDAPAGAQDVCLLKLRFVPGVNEKSLFVPFLEWPVGRYRVAVANPTSTAQTVLYVAELYRMGEEFSPRRLKHWAINDLAIRDTSLHTYSTDPAYIEVFENYPGFPFKNTAIFVGNSLDEAVTISVSISSPPRGVTLGTKNVAAGQSALISPTDFPALNYPWDDLRLSAQCSAAPTTGTVSAIVLSQF